MTTALSSAMRTAVASPASPRDRASRTTPLQIITMRVHPAMGGSASPSSSNEPTIVIIGATPRISG
jgi:hypothetical protein